MSTKKISKQNSDVPYGRHNMSCMNLSGDAGHATIFR